MDLTARTWADLSTCVKWMVKMPISKAPHILVLTCLVSTHSRRAPRIGEGVRRNVEHEQAPTVLSLLYQLGAGGILRRPTLLPSGNRAPSVAQT